MPEGLQTPEGTRVDIPPVEEFASLQAAQAAAADEQGQAEPPPKKDPEAPYGRKADGTPKKGPGGRPSTKNAAKDAEKDRPRVASSAPPAGPKRDYSEPLAELADAVWVAMAMAPHPTFNAQAALWQANKGGLVAGFNTAAQNNGMIRRFVEGAEKKTWVLALAGAVMPLVQQSVMLWTNPGQELEGGGRLVDVLAASTRQELENMARAQAEAMAAAAAAAAPAAA